MKKIFRTVAALAVVAFAGCTTDFNDEVVAPGITGGTTVTVGIADTKTYLGELVDGARKVYWHNGDQIAINGNASTAITLNEEKTSAEFEFGAELTHPYSVLYPASMYKDAQTITLPAVQNGATNNFAKDTAPMASYQAAEGIVQMHHLAGVIRLQVKLPAESAHTAHPLNKVETKGNAGEQMSGDFAIDYEAVTLTATSTAEADKVVTTSASKELSAEETDDVFIVVPAREYPQGITVRLIDNAGHYMDIASKGMTIEAGEIKAMPVVEFKPTGTLVNVEIKSAADFVAFSKAYNDGEYWQVHPFVVQLANDIEFDAATSAELVPIGNVWQEGNPLGIAAGETNYFHGYFDGNGFSIKNWNSTRPLFAYTGGGAIIENIIIDESCTLTANYADGVEYYGPFVGYHRGSLLNCTNNANIAVSGTWGDDTRIGGLVGRCVIGIIDSCTNNGDIIYNSNYVLSKGTNCVGGITSYISNTSGTVQNSTNTGEIVVNGTVGTLTSYIGGIVGYSIGTVDNNTNSGATTINAISKKVYIGGIVGWATNEATATTNNTNNGDVLCTTGAERNDNNGRNIYVGGIIGQADSKITGNTNNANVTTTSSAKDTHIGGIAGYLKTTDIAKNSVANNIVVEGKGQGRYSGIGGFAGTIEVGVYDFANYEGTFDCTVKGAQGNALDKNNTYCVGVGGVFGLVSGTAGEVVIKNITWKGKISIVGTYNTGHHAAAFGGILGHIYNNANTTIENATFEGSIEANYSVAIAQRTVHAIGGIVGSCGPQGGLTIKNCTNNTDLTYTRGVSDKGRPIFVGGIAGFIQGGDCTIEGCNSNKLVYANTYNNSGFGDGSQWRANHVGGIIAVYGDHVYTENKASAEVITTGSITIKDCNITGQISAYRGIGGGVVAWARDAQISNCTVTANKDVVCNGTAGGIIAVGTNCTITNCSVVNKVTGASSGSHNGHAGGIAAYLDGTSTVDNCKYYGDVKGGAHASQATYVGGISGWTASSVTIKDSKFGGTVNSVAINAENFSDYMYQYNIASATGDTVTPTVTGCSYWNGK